MSSLWTPEGEKPVGRRPSADDDQLSSQEPSEEELATLRAQLAETPAAIVVTNHCLGLWELAALHISLQPPQLDEAAVAIDALGAVVERLGGRLGDDEGTLRDALAQLRLAFVQVKAATGASGSGGDPSGNGAPAPASTGGAEDGDDA